MSKTKKTLLNLITDVIPLIIVSLLGIFKFKFFIEYLGQETMGLYNLFNNIMVYVSLVDGGISSAILFSLYRPNANNDSKKLSQLLSGAYKTFSKIGMIVFGLAFIVSFFVYFLIKNSIFDYWYIVLTFLLFSLSNVIAYFFVPYNELLEVKEKKYVYNIISQTGQIVLSIVEIIMLISGFKFTYILIMHSLVKLIANLILAYVSKRMFPNINLHNKEKDFSFKKYLKSLVFHKINGLIGSNIDTVIISSVLGLSYVAVYSTYAYIVRMLENIISKLSSSMTAIVGNDMIKNKAKMHELFMEFNGMFFFVAISICVPLTLAINGFIDIFYEGKIVTSILIALSFSLILFIHIIRLNTITFVNAAGLYKETKFCAITDTIINLVLSITLVHFIGIAGVLIATVFSVFIAEYILKTMVIYKHIFKKDPSYYFINNTKFFVVFVIDLILGYYITNMIIIDKLIIWLIVYVLFTIFNAILLLIIFKLFRETKFVKRVSVLKRRV